MSCVLASDLQWLHHNLGSVVPYWLSFPMVGDRAVSNCESLSLFWVSMATVVQEGPPVGKSITILMVLYQDWRMADHIREGCLRDVFSVPHTYRWGGGSREEGLRACSLQPSRRH